MRHLTAIVNGNFGVISAIAEPVAERAQLARQILREAGCPQPHIYADARMLLRHESPDWIVISSPDAFHEAHLLAVAAHSARVLMEPPLANDLAGWEKVALQSFPKPGRFFVASSWRQDPEQAGSNPPSPDTGNGGLKEWQCSWAIGNGILGPLGFGLLDLATRDMALGAPVRVLAAGDGGMVGASPRAPRHLMAMCWLSDGATIGWSEPEWRSGSSGEVIVRNGAGRVLRSVPSSRIRQTDHDAGRTMGLWKSIIADVEKGHLSTHRMENFHANMRLWLSVKAAIISGRTEVFPSPSSPFS